MPLAMSNLGFCFGVGLTPILVIQFLKVSNLNPEISNFFTKHCEMIHDNRIAHSSGFFEQVLKNSSGLFCPRVTPVEREIPPRFRSGQALGFA